MGGKMFGQIRRCPFIPELAHLHFVLELLKFRIPMQYREYLTLLRIAEICASFQASCSEPLGPVTKG